MMCGAARTRKQLIEAGLAMAMIMGIATLVPAQEPRPEGDLKKLQGDWVSSNKDGTQESHWTFKGNRPSLKTPTRNYRMTIELVPTKDPKKAVNFRVDDDSPNAPKAFVKGIYRFDSNDSLERCAADREADRPTSFKVEPGGTAGDTNRSFHWVLKRSKQ
jgi:uncharacterized protein (TIGR03067 family)